MPEHGANLRDSLHLKSTDGTGNTPSSSNAVLCTPDKTYEIRQVSTSNTVFVTRPVATSEDVFSSPGLEAIAQPGSTLEVFPAKNVSAIPYIVAALPSYTSTGHYTSSDAISKNDCFANIPLSEGECGKAWTELSCFELSNPKRSLVPSAGMKLKAWKGLLAAATAEGRDLTQSLDQQGIDLLLNDDKEWPKELCMAVLQSMQAHQDETDHVELDETKCTIFVGQCLLKDRADASQGPILTTEFVSTWADLVPEKWRLRAEVELLEGCSCFGKNGKDITWSDNVAGPVPTGTDTAPSETKSTLGAKRKWHDKFRASKKTA